MPDFSNIKFSPKELIQLGVFLVTIFSMWADLKTDQVKSKEKDIFLQYQIDELKKLAVNEKLNIKSYK